MLNEIFDTAVRTVTLCHQNGLLWDGIKRDRIVWIGDLFPEALAVLDLSFDKKRVFDCLEIARKESDFPFWINSIPCYSMWYLLVLWDLYEKTGNQSYLETNREFVVSTLKQIDKGIDKNGNIDFKSIAFDEDMTFFLDWESFRTEDAVTGVKCFIFYAMRVAEKILAVLNESASAVESIRAKIGDFYGVPTARKQIKAFQCLAYDKFTESDKEFLLKGNNSGISCFMTYFIFKVLCKVGEYDKVLRFIKDYYGGMLKMGATTFFEDFDLAWLKDDPLPLYEFEKDGRKHIHADYGRFCYTGFRHSCCHGWSAGVVPLLFEEIAGVEILDAGYKKVKIEPKLCSLKFIDAGIPTPYGLLQIKAYKKDGKTVVEKIVPQGIEVVK